MSGQPRAKTDEAERRKPNGRVECGFRRAPQPYFRFGTFSSFNLATMSWPAVCRLHGLVDRAILPVGSM